MTALKKIRLGKTELYVTKCSFGALPIQRASREEAIAIFRAALDGGINFFDTARNYTDSESKMGEAFEGRREHAIIASKSAAKTADKLLEDLNTSLSELRTDYIDLFQFHLAAKCHRSGEEDGLYEAALEAKREGRIRHIGLTAHRLDVAMEAAQSGLYETIQYPFSYLSSQRDMELVALCRKEDLGFIAMKALSGGLITDAATATAFMNEEEGVVPIWGIQRMSELEEFLRLTENPPAMDDEMQRRIENDKKELAGNFCRACGYCRPCPVGIEINWAARMSLTIRRMSPALFMTDEWAEKMRAVENCTHCGACAKKCPYELDPPKLMAAAREDYFRFRAEWLKQQN